MDVTFSEEQEELRATARAFLQEHSSSERIRSAMESELGYDPGVWKQLGAELGWTAVTIPEEYGGLGLSYVELVALLEVMGESLLCAPYFSSIGLGANALLVAGSEAQKQEHLPGIAEGTTRATLAWTSAAGDWDVGGIDTLVRRDGDGFVLDGRPRFVLDGHCADLLVIGAREAGSTGDDGVSLFIVRGDAEGLSRHALPSMDQTRRLAQLELSGVRVDANNLMGELGQGAAALRKTLDLAAVAMAAEQVGGAQRCLDMAVDYAKERVQFGRPIGSFQAIKHKCANVMVEVESARSALYYAGCAAAEDSDELSSVAPLAKATCSDAFFHAAAECLQIHGGVGFTWEYDVHLFFKRAKSTETFLGDAPYHRERIARQIGL